MQSQGQKGKKRLRDGRTIVLVDPADLQPQQVEVLRSLGTIRDDPNGLEKLLRFESIFQSLLSAYEYPDADSTLPATFFDSILSAKEAVGVEYNPRDQLYHWQLREESIVGDGKLSPWADDCITNLIRSKYFQQVDSESCSRTVIDVIFCDRLNGLDDQNADRHLNWLPEMSVSTRSTKLGKTIRGKVDWCLAHGNEKTEVDTTLVVLEAKKIGQAESGLPQLIIYLAAIQDKRKAASKENCSAFGILSDSASFIFAHLDSNRKLFVSRSHSWHSEKARIIQWIDSVLANAIHASPHTTPVKKRNTSLKAYDRFLKKGFQFGSEDSVEIVENQTIRCYDIIRTHGCGYLVKPRDDEEHEEENDEEPDKEMEDTNHPD